MRHKAVVIEDDDNSRYLLTVLLEHAGFEVITAANGRRGIEAARRSSPDVILLDIEMPGMDGYETAARLRGEPGLESVPIVGVSALAMAGDRNRALHAGFAAYVEKPVDPDTFGQIVAELAGQRT